ncbi:MAG: alpha/beta hydrolase [Verrucomicrobiae bacterium]|nr:alpha/beta hydrolase [Verrucomicrobiae bacterium]MCP5516588.1 alpha/beta hydrolase [Verrucomicrobiales bacterium]MCP5527718.1 alpha/beta hydrolase [Verrucomicrobiales bacterium]
MTPISRFIATLLVAASAGLEGAVSRAADAVPVWPEAGMPGDRTAAPESEVPRNDGFHRRTHVSQPTLTRFPASNPQTTPTPAMIVCPGGGYRYVVVDKEGSEIAAWLNANGIAALVLKYRVPDNREGALQDLQRAVSLTRTRAAEWNLDPRQIGVIGFSAGGHLAARVSTQFEERAYPAIDAVDQASCRPDFAVLIYPAYLDDQQGHVSPDLDPTANIPPTLLVHSEDDRTHVPGSKVYHAALETAKVPHKFQLYPTGGHGYGLHCEQDARAWPEDALEWLASIGIR